MNKFLAVIIIIISFSCQSNKEQGQLLEIAVNTPPTYESINKKTPMVGPKTYPEPYKLDMKINELESNVYELELDMKLFNGSYFVSPHAKRDFKGKFTVQLDDNTALISNSELIETPRSVEEYDAHPFVRGNVNWVREDTKYQLQLKRTSEDKFLVKGFIQFTIEPRCTLEKIPIIISYEGGKMHVAPFGC